MADNLTVTGNISRLAYERFSGIVEDTLFEESIMRSHVNVQTVKGTNTISNDRIGASTLQAITPNTTPDANEIKFGKVSVTVDTVILARAAVFTLDTFQMHFDVQSEIGKAHGKLIAEFFDQAVLIQGIKSASSGTAQTNEGTPENLKGWSASGGVNSIDTLFGLTTPNTYAEVDDTQKANLLERAISLEIVKMEEKKIDTKELTIFVRPRVYNLLTMADKLINKDFANANGDYSAGKVMVVNDVRLQKTTALPNEVITDHELGTAYNVSATEAKTLALIMSPKALLAGETIPLTTKVWESDAQKKWFIDAWLAFACTPDRGEYSSVIRSA